MRKWGKQNIGQIVNREDGMDANYLAVAPLKFKQRFTTSERQHVDPLQDQLLLLSVLVCCLWLL